jgi:pSer/pThr/pTyr-binding forkhead associated (FHA) protein
VADATVAVRDEAIGEDEDDAAERTLVMRSSDVGQVERTVMLRLQPSLTITRGASQGQVFPLSMDSAVSLGRAPTNDIPLFDTAVSGEHCRIRPEEGGFVLHDLGSTNGTYVNEKRIERHRLSEGDTIRVGETHFQFRMGPA